MAVTSREELKHWALHKLGHPVIKVNLHDTQMEERIDEALQVFQEWHYDGTEKLFMKHQLKASKMVLDSSFAPGVIVQGWKVTGLTSGAVANIWGQSTPQTVDYYLANGSFILGEAVHMSSTGDPTKPDGVNAHIQNVAGSITLNEFENRSIDIPNTVLSVSKIFPIQLNTAGTYLFDGQYYTMLDLMFNFKGGDLITYDMTKQHLNLIQQMMGGEKNVRFNHLTGKLYVDLDWQRAVKPDTWLIIECYRILDPSQYLEVWNDQFVKSYTTVLFKEQWAQNLGKFANIQLLGGVTLSAAEMKTEAKEEKKELEDALRNRWSQPLGFLLG